MSATTNIDAGGIAVENNNGPDFSGPSMSGTPRQSVFVVPSNHLEHFTIFLQSKT
jgi:hypothetical protein